MGIYKLRLIDRKEVAEKTVVFVFEKPKDLCFIPGQYAGFTLIDPQEKDAGGITRRFSLLSTPDDPFISIATRFQDTAYKRELIKLPIGNEIKFAGPTGNFILHEDVNRPAILIAGGIGITPFFSMVRFASENKSPQKIVLFYGNQQMKDAAFLGDLEEIQNINPHFKLVATMAIPSPSWKGETGFITDIMLKKYIPDLKEPIYYICGSAVMVTTLQEALAEMDINEDNIRVEDFPGY